jgi:hypothetical protein
VEGIALLRWGEVVGLIEPEEQFVRLTGRVVAQVDDREGEASNTSPNLVRKFTEEETIQFSDPRVRRVRAAVYRKDICEKISDRGEALLSIEEGLPPVELTPDL